MILITVLFSLMALITLFACLGPILDGNWREGRVLFLWGLGFLFIALASGGVIPEYCAFTNKALCDLQ